MAMTQADFDRITREVQNSLRSETQPLQLPYITIDPPEDKRDWAKLEEKPENFQIGGGLIYVGAHVYGRKGVDAVKITGYNKKADQWFSVRFDFGGYDQKSKWVPYFLKSTQEKSAYSQFRSMVEQDNPIVRRLTECTINFRSSQRRIVHEHIAHAINAALDKVETANLLGEWVQVQSKTYANPIPGGPKLKEARPRTEPETVEIWARNGKENGKIRQYINPCRWATLIKRWNKENAEAKSKAKGKSLGKAKVFKKAGITDPKDIARLMEFEVKDVLSLKDTFDTDKIVELLTLLK